MQLQTLHCSTWIGRISRFQPRNKTQITHNDLFFTLRMLVRHLTMVPNSMQIGTQRIICTYTQVLGWLETEYGDYQYEDKYGGIVDLSGRELAHSPNFTFSVGGTYRTDSGWFANVNASGKKRFLLFR